MYEIKVKASFSAAHNLKNYKGKCERLHGHNWLVEGVFSYESLGKDGMAVDFRIARRAVKKVVEKLDHSYLNDLNILKKINPTSENVAKFIYDSVKKKIVNLKSITVWENENSCAMYTEP